MKSILLTLIIVMPFYGFSQSKKEKRASTDGGLFQLGVRSTVSAFGATNYPGTGAGGQFRVKLRNKLNTEWFADYITTDIGGLGKRIDGHIGWSVMFYPFHDYGKKKATPYIVAGHCFDYTKVSENQNLFLYRMPYSKERWSSAAQMGIGLHYHLTEKADLTLKTQYMTHLGNDIHAGVKETDGIKYFYMDDAKNHVTLEGHILFTLSLNIKITDLW